MANLDKCAPFYKRCAKGPNCEITVRIAHEIVKRKCYRLWPICNGYRLAGISAWINTDAHTNEKTVASFHRFYGGENFIAYWINSRLKKRMLIHVYTVDFTYKGISCNRNILLRTIYKVVIFKLCTEILAYIHKECVYRIHAVCDKARYICFYIRIST